MFVTTKAKKNKNVRLCTYIHIACAVEMLFPWPGVTVNSLHPGSVYTRLVDNLPWPVPAIMEVVQYLFFRVRKK